MELRSDPEMKTNLHEERMFFWEKMLWQEKERAVSRKILYQKSTKFLLETFNV